MDSKGAQELARFLVERHGAVPEPAPISVLKAKDAAPVFHWLGIEPPDPAPGSAATGSK
jgi:hypothetical protein